MPLIPDRLARWLPARASAQARTLTVEATAPDAKASRAGPVMAFENLGQPVWSTREYPAFAREGVMQNAVVYRCVRMIAEAAASIPILLYDRDTELSDHPLISLLKAPSPGLTGQDFFESWYGYLLVSGNTYAEVVTLDGIPRELHALRPDRMSIIPGPSGWPEAYAYTANGGTVRFRANDPNAISPILHLRLFHPLNDHYGLSPIEAAATAIDIHNQASKWNKALLDNAARPSGALVYAAREGRLSPEQFERLKAELQEGFQGAKNAGRPLLLEGGLDWKPLSMSPKDMDFIEAKNAAARDIALALGVPPMLLGIPGDNTYSNYAEAQRAFWRQTVLPLVTRTTKALSSWLGCSGALTFQADLDQVDALAPEREALWARLEKSSFLTDAEKRLAVGYPAEPDLPATKFNPNHDSAGRFSSGPGSGITQVGGRGGGRTPPKPPAAPPPAAPAKPAAPQAPTTKPRPDFLDKKPGQGKITGNTEKLTPAEKTFANEMRDLGNDIEIVPRGEGRTPDFKINGVIQEYKNVSGVQRTDVEGLSSAISSRIMDGRGQSGNIIVDARNQSGMTPEAAQRAIGRAYGADAKKGINSITILLPDGQITAPRSP